MEEAAFSLADKEQIQRIWNEIGYTKSEYADVIRPLYDKIDQLKADFIRTTVKQCQILTMEIEQTKKDHIKLLMIMGASQVERLKVENSGKTGSLKERKDEVKERYEKTKAKFENRYNQFASYVDDLEFLFQTLEIPYDDRGEFNAVGDKDLTNHRLGRFKAKKIELEDLVNENNKLADDLTTQIVDKSKLTEIEVSYSVQPLLTQRPLRPSEIELLKDELEALTYVEENHKQKIATLALEIQRLWDILKVSETEKKEFFKENQLLSFNSILGTINYLNELNRRRNAEIPEHIDRTTEEIRQTCRELHYTEEQADAIINEAYAAAEIPNAESNHEEEDEAPEPEVVPIEEAPQNIEEDIAKDNERKENTSETKEEEEVKENNHNEEEEIKQIEKEEETKQIEKEEEEEEEEESEIEQTPTVEVIPEEDSIENAHLVPIGQEALCTPIKAQDETERVIESDSNAKGTEEEEDFAVPTEPELPEPIPNTPEEEARIRLFELLDAKLIHLQRIKKASAPIVDLIQQRETLIREHEEAEKAGEVSLKPVRKPESAIRRKPAPEEPRREEDNGPPPGKPEWMSTTEHNRRKSTKTARKTADNRDDVLRKLPHAKGVHEKTVVLPPDPAEALRVEKIRRRFKTVLPRVEKKLKAALLKFADEYGEDFTWDGEVYIEKLADVKITETDMRMSRRSSIKTTKL